MKQDKDRDNKPRVFLGRERGGTEHRHAEGTASAKASLRDMLAPSWGQQDFMGNTFYMAAIGLCYDRVKTISENT